MDILIRRFNNKKHMTFKSFIKNYKGYEVYDWYEHLYVQNEFIKNPSCYFGGDETKSLFKKRLLKNKFPNGSFFAGTWVIFPENRKIFHLLDQDEFLDMRTSRNRDVIKHEEQKILYNKKILFIGMSVGSQVLMTFVRTGIGNNYVIADADDVELHNLNRTNFSLEDLGKKKVEVVKKQVQQIDPYIKIEAVSEYITERNLASVLAGVDLVVDSFDSFRVKILLRKLAKKLKIPVLSGFDVSKGAMVITERYDVDKSLGLDFYLNGYSDKDILKAGKLNVEDKTNLFINLVGRKYHDSRMLDSVLRVGKDLSGYPQLAIATNLTSSMWTVAALDILLNRNKKSVRFYLNLEKEIYGKLK